MIYFQFAFNILVQYWTVMQIIFYPMFGFGLLCAMPHILRSVFHNV